MLEIFLARGYQELRVEDQSLFDPYYDSMNDHWSANTSFLNLIGWRDSYPTYFKIAEGLLINITYLNTEGYPVAVPFVGNYTEEKIKKVMQILKEDFAGFDAQLIIMDVVPWMLPL